MRKYKLFYTYRDEDGCKTSGSALVEGVNEDEACRKFEEENPYIAETMNGFDDVWYMPEHPIMSQRLIKCMPNGVKYVIPVAFLINEMGFKQFYQGKASTVDYESHIDFYVLPIATSGLATLIEWSAENIEWKDVMRKSHAVIERVSDVVMNAAWKETKNLDIVVEVE